MKPMTVTELTLQIKAALSAANFQNLAVEGEVSNFVHHTSGHMYFSLKDEKSRLKAVMFRSRNRGLDFVPKNGDTLIAVGALGVYEPNGEYQLYVDLLLPRGIGDLHLAFEQLKAKLKGEGLFADERKKPLPFLPAKIGVITSRTGAALRDILNVVHRRHPGVRILVFPAVVQGEGAAASLIRALALAETTDVEVIIMGRGGGSFEELSAFNDESLARAIARCTIPIISAVGHETDYSIADFVADLRAPTPSAAAELAVPLRDELLGTVAGLRERAVGAVKRQIASERRYLNQLSAAPTLRQPANIVRQLRQRTDELWTSIVRQHKHSLALRRARLEAGAGKLETLSPLKTLGRGYAICYDQKGQVLVEPGAVEIGARVGVRLHGGRLQCKVEGRETHE